MPPAPEAATGILLAQSLCLLAGLLPALLQARLRFPAWLAYAPSTLACILGLGASLETLGTARPATLDLPLRLGGMVASFRLEPLSAWFALGVFGVALVVSLAAQMGFGRLRSDGPGDSAAFHVILLGLLLVLTAGDALSLLFSWELLAIGGWTALFAGGARDGEGASAAFRWFAAAQLGAALIAAGFFVAAGQGGLPALHFPALGQAAASASPAARSLAFLLLLAGFGVFAGVLPFAAPQARAQALAAPAAAALLASSLPRAGLYGLTRVLFDWLPQGPAWWGSALVLLAAATALLSWLMALVATDLRRVLGHTLLASGALAALALGLAQGLAAHDARGAAAHGVTIALYASLAHALLGAALALDALAAIHLAGSARLDAVAAVTGGAGRASSLLLLPAATAAALPPSGQFLVAWSLGGLLLLTLSLPMGLAKLAALAAAIAGGLASALGPIALLRLFLRAPADAPAPPPERLFATQWLRAAAAVLALGALALGLFAGPLLREIAPAAAALTGHDGFVASLTLPQVGQAADWPGPLQPLSAGPVLARLGVPALISALLLATLVPFALLRFPRRPGPAAEAAGREDAGPALTAQGCSQPFGSALKLLYGEQEEATILEGKAALFPTRISFHHALRPLFDRWSAGLRGAAGPLEARLQLLAGAATLRARATWLLAVLVLLLVLGGA